MSEKLETTDPVQYEPKAMLQNYKKWVFIEKSLVHIFRKLEKIGDKVNCICDDL